MSSQIKLWGNKKKPFLREIAVLKSMLVQSALLKELRHDILSHFFHGPNYG